MILQQAQLQQLLLRNQQQQAATAAAAGTEGIRQQAPVTPERPAAVSGARQETMNSSPSGTEEAGLQPMSSSSPPDVAATAVADVSNAVGAAGSLSSSPLDTTSDDLVVTSSVSVDCGGAAPLRSSSEGSGVNRHSSVTRLNDDDDDDDIVESSGDLVPVVEQEGKEINAMPSTSLDTQ